MLVIKSNIGVFYSFFDLYGFMKRNKIYIVHGVASYGAMKDESFNLSLSRLRCMIYKL